MRVAKPGQFANILPQKSNWNWPDISGLQNFEGHLAHSAHWDGDYSFKDKKVAIIGCGSSAIQIVPQIQPGMSGSLKDKRPSADDLMVVKHLTSFNRSATWIVPEFAEQLAPEGRDTMIAEELKAKWRQNPEELLKYRKEVDSVMNHFFDLQYKGSKLQQETVEATRTAMEKRLQKKPQLAKVLVPGFAVGCRR